jgi:hypothetical protein
VTAPEAVTADNREDSSMLSESGDADAVVDGRLSSIVSHLEDADFERSDPTITPGPDNGVQFRSVLVDEEPRPAVHILNPLVPRDHGLPAVPVCSWCAAAHDGEQWRRIEDVARDLRLLEELVPGISYGLCPTCRDRISSSLVDASEITGP